MVADIAAHLPARTISGAVYIAPCPYLGPILQEIGTPLVVDLVSRFTSDKEVAQAEETLSDFEMTFYNKVEDVPWETRALWRGMATFQSAQHRQFVLTRSQDPTRLLELGKRGLLPVLTLCGSQDVQVDLKGMEREIKRCFPGSEFYVVEGGSHALHLGNKEEVMLRVSAFVRKLAKFREQK